jgi:hypothetical protein
MGVFKPFSSCSEGDTRQLTAPVVKPPVRRKKNGNPNPRRFEIKLTEKHGPFLIVLIHYPDCRNYEGWKLLLYVNVSKKELLKRTELDPHFCDKPGHLAPVARFEPTERGRSYARSVAKAHLASASAKRKSRR